jgi:hypothetical protein
LFLFKHPKIFREFLPRPARRAEPPSSSQGRHASARFASTCAGGAIARRNGAHVRRPWRASRRPAGRKAAIEGNRPAFFRAFRRPDAVAGVRKHGAADSIRDD